MSALPPLADHRLAVLRALDTLGARYSADGVTMGAIGDHADLDAGQVWLACSQLQHGGFIVATDSMPGAHPDLGGDNRRTWSLTEQGRNVALYEDGGPGPDALCGVLRTRVDVLETFANLMVRTSKTMLEDSPNDDETSFWLDIRNHADAALLTNVNTPEIPDAVREHVMPGDPPGLGQAALQWFLKLEFGAPHSLRESNIAVESFKDGVRYKGLWQPISTAPNGQDVLVFRHDGGAPWSYGFVELARRDADDEDGDADWWLADGSSPITTPLLWMAFEKPTQPEGWRP